MSGYATQKWLKVSLVLWLFQNVYSDCLIPDLEIPNGDAIILPPLDEQNDTFAKEMTVIRFRCFDGYLMIGNYYMQCVEGKWTDNVLPFCSGLVCSNPPEVEYASYVAKSLMDALLIGSIAEYECNEGYELENINASTLLCVIDIKSRMAVWQGEMPVCKIVLHCPDPGVSKHGRRFGSCCTWGDYFLFYCNHGYNLIGEGIIVCMPSGVWSSDRPLCRPREEYCQPPSKIPHGVITGDKSGDYFVPGEKAVIVCDPGYGVNGASFSECWKGGVWRRKFGTCEDYYKCGLGVEAVDVNTSLLAGREVNRWPWMAALYRKVRDDPPVSIFMCGGSIIHQRFILTAAHCMFKRMGVKYNESEIIVKLGLTNRSNTTHLQEFEILKVIIPDKYHHYVSYDYDIALLYLDRPIEYGLYIRPICLPTIENLPDESRIYQPHSMVWAAGWGDNEKQKKGYHRNVNITKILKEMNFPIQTRENCTRSLRDEKPPLDHHFTDRMFCTGDGLGREDTCRGDSGSPAMQFVVSRDGYPNWIQVGIISWGLGCRLKTEYGFNTHLGELMPWVEEEMERVQQLDD